MVPALTAKVEAKSRVVRQIAARRRYVRTGSLVVYALMLWAFWAIATLPFLIIEDSSSYDPAFGLTIETKGCDVQFTKGIGADIRLQARSTAGRLKFTTGAGGKVTYIDVRNVAGCEDEPMRSCATVCVVNVVVPPEAASASFTLLQFGDDESWPVAYIDAGVSMGTLKVGGYAGSLRPKTLSVRLRDQSTVGTLTAYMVHGSLYANNATINSIWFESASWGCESSSSPVTCGVSSSAYLLGLTTGAADLVVSYRQPSNRICLASDEPSSLVTWVEEPDAWQGCDIRDILTGTGSSNYFSHTLLRALYDADGDNQVTGADFQRNLGKISCCGSNCPFSTWYPHSHPPDNLLPHPHLSLCHEY